MPVFSKFSRVLPQLPQRVQWLIVISAVAASSIVQQRRRATQTKALVNHPFISWLLENGSVALVACIRAWLGEPDRADGLVRMIIKNALGGLIIVELPVALQMFLSEVVFKHVPWFNESERPKAFSLRSWLQANLPVHLIGGFAFAKILMLLPDQDYEKLLKSRAAPFRLFPFLGKLFVVRFVADIVFYLVHRALHTKLLYFLHKRHHQHKATGLPTNFHFSTVDLILEGFLPLFSGILAVEQGLGLESSYIEIALFAAYTQWYEIGSHLGKPAPIVSYYPPIAPLYNALLGDIDRNNVQFHETHHNKVRCNYGITQWIDFLFGTAV